MCLTTGLYHVLKEIEKRETSFLNRLNTTAYVFEKNRDDEFVKLDFLKLRKQIHPLGVSILDKLVYIGTSEKYKLRLVIEEIPEDKINERIRKIKKEAKKKKNSKKRNLSKGNTESIYYKCSDRNFTSFKSEIIISASLVN